MKHTHIHTLRHTPPFSQSAYTNSKPKITWNNAFSVKLKCKNSQIKIIRFTHPQPSLRKLSSSTDVLTHAHSQLMTGIIFIKNWHSWETTLARDHPDEKSPWETTLMRDHPEEGPTLMKDHPMNLCKITERPPWSATILTREPPWWKVDHLDELIELALS